MLWKKTALLFFVFAVWARADADPAALQKQIQDLEKRERRENQKVDQAEEQDRVKLRARERDELAKAQRDADAAATQATATAMTTGTTATIDTAKLAAAKFAQDEVRNLIQNQLGAEITLQYTKQRNEITRRYALERARLEAQQAGGDAAGDDAAKQKDLAIKTAELNNKYQEKYDDLALQQSTEEFKLRYSHQTKLNAAERDLGARTTKFLFEQTQKGGAAGFNPAADPEIQKLTAARDAEKNALETDLDELRAKYNAKRTDIDNAKEDDTAKLNGS